MTLLLSFVSGVIFAVGLCVSGMVRPSKVIGFLRLGPDWDPSLAFVMLGALALHALAWRWTRRHSAPLLGGTLPGPAPKLLDGPLLVGSALFGVGWGIGGYCPGPAIAASAITPSAALFVASMLIGMVLHKLALPLISKKFPASTSQVIDG